MPKFKLPVTHVITIEDKEVGETRKYELCTKTKAAWALKDHLAKRLDTIEVTLTDHTLDQVVEDEVATYNEVFALVESGLVFCDSDESSPY